MMLQPLDRESASPYLGMTYPAHRGLLARCGGDCAAVGASLLGQPVGLALACVGGTSGSLLSLLVADGFRGEGIATAMLSLLEEELCRRGCARVSCVYTADKPATPAFERVLSKQGWSEAQPHSIFCKADRRLCEGPWMRRRRLPAPFRAFPWAELTPREADVLAQAAQPGGWIPEWASPFRFTEYLEPGYSLGLRCGDEVVGWMITRRVVPDTLAYSVLLVREEYRAGCGLPLIAETMHRHFSDPEGPPFGSVLARLSNAPMAAFIDRWLRPYALKVWESRQSSKALRAGGSLTPRG